MEFSSLNCPQCGGLLPRAALWRMVRCPYCTAMVTRSTLVVEARAFHEAWLRTRIEADASMRTIRLGDIHYRILARLGGGNASEAFLADRLDPLPERVVIRHALDGSPPGVLAREYAVLGALQALEGPGAAYFSQRLPQAISLAQSPQMGREALVTRHIPGCWGSLADVLQRQGQGIDPRHGVWIWRRILDTLGYLHANGWVHGDLHPGHVLVQPGDHGAFLIGWSRARIDSDPKAMADDLARSAWCVRALLHGAGGDEPGTGVRTPPAFAKLLRQVSENTDGATDMGAQGIDSALKAAAREGFGPPRFIHFDPEHSGTTSRKDGT